MGGGGKTILLRSCVGDLEAREPEGRAVSGSRAVSLERAAIVLETERDRVVSDSGKSF